MAEALANVAVACGIALAGVSLLLFVVGLASYRRLHHPRLLWASVAFLMLAVQGVLLTQDAFARRSAIADGAFPWPIAAGLGVAAALYLSVLQR